MKYENPHIPEGINTSREHPLRNFAALLIGALFLVFILSLVLGFSGSWLAGKIPFSAENKIAEMHDMSQHSDNKKHPELAQYLESIADKISKIQNLADTMKITVHYMDDSTVNAFATLGGNLFIYRGLLERLPNENTLVTLLAHEIAHVKYRHPIKSLGRGIAVSIAMTAITGSSKSQLLGDAGLLTVLKFSRDMELQSDEEAMATLHSLYGHLGGGAELFSIFGKMRQSMDVEEPAEIFSTHPLDQHRIDNFSAVAKKRGWKETGSTTPLPGFYKKAFD